MVTVDSESELQRGDPAPSFELPGVDDEKHSLSTFLGSEALLIVFTCNHCPYAQAKFEELNHLANTVEELAVVGVNPNDAEEYPEDSFEKMHEYVENGTIEYDAYLRDESQSVAATYGAVCTPDPFLFENDNDTFRLAYHGRIDDALNPNEEPTTHEMREIVEAVLAGEDVPYDDRPSRGCSIKWTDGGPE